MLDKELCRVFNVDPFMEWIQNKLDDLEDTIYSDQLKEDELNKTKTHYDALIEARDKYWELHIKKV